MSQSALSEIVRKFLTEHVDSVAQLELLLLLRTSAPKPWTIAQLVEELRVDAEWASQRLDSLGRSGLVKSSDESDASYAFDPASPQIAEAAAAVAQAYLVHRVSVIEFIYSRPNDSIQAFADAFRFRKEPPRG